MITLFHIWAMFEGSRSSLTILNYHTETNNSSLNKIYFQIKTRTWEILFQSMILPWHFSNGRLQCKCRSIKKTYHFSAVTMIQEKIIKKYII